MWAGRIMLTRIWLPAINTVLHYIFVTGIPLISAEQKIAQQLFLQEDGHSTLIEAASSTNRLFSGPPLLTMVSLQTLLISIVSALKASL